MKWYPKAAAGGLLWLSLSAVAFGDSLHITGQPENVLEGGQFTAYLQSAPAQTLLVYCVDYANDIVNGDQTYISTPNMTVSPFDGLANTRYGQTPTADFSFFNSGSGTLASGTAPLNALQRYVLAAWLTTQYNFSSGVNMADDQIQDAIWTLLTVNGTGGFPYQDSAGDGTYTTKAEQWLGAQSTSALTTFESQIRIFTSAGTIPYTGAASGPGSSWVSGSQEMICTTPEPASLAMLGAGLVGIGLLRKRFQA